MVQAAETCAGVILAVRSYLPEGHAQAATLTAKAYNRRGDALLLLGKPEEALADYEAALPLAPEDSYILYNRGRARLALGLKEEARADFEAVLDPKFNQPKARKLAEEALARVD